MVVEVRRAEITTHGAVKTFVHLPNHHHNHQLMGGEERAIIKITVRKHLLVRGKKNDQH